MRRLLIGLLLRPAAHASLEFLTLPLNTHHLTFTDSGFTLRNR